MLAFSLLNLTGFYSEMQILPPQIITFIHVHMSWWEHTQARPCLWWPSQRGCHTHLSPVTPTYHPPITWKTRWPMFIPDFCQKRTFGLDVETFQELPDTANANDTGALLLRRVKAKLDMVRRVMEIRGRKKENMYTSKIMFFRLLNCGQGNEKGGQGCCWEFPCNRECVCRNIWYAWS